MIHIAQRLVDSHSGRRAAGFLRFIVLIVGLGAVLVAADDLSSMRVNGRPSPAPSGGAGSTPPLPVGIGPFWYTRTMGTMRHPFCLKHEIIRPGSYGRCDLTVWFEVEMSTETWVGVDGTMRERTVEAWQRFASPGDRTRWTAHRKRLPPPVSVDQGDGLVIGEGHFPPDLFGDNGGDVPPIEGPPTGSGPVDVGDGLFTYAQLLSLPDSPTAAVRRIDQAEAALHRRYAQTLRRWHSPGADLQARRNLTPQPRGIRSIEDLLAISHLRSMSIIGLSPDEP